MAYATLMVQLELEHPNDARLRIAGDLAERFAARLIGIAACEQSTPLYYADGAFAQGLLEHGSSWRSGWLISSSVSGPLPRAAPRRSNGAARSPTPQPMWLSRRGLLISSSPARTATGGLSIQPGGSTQVRS